MNQREFYITIEQSAVAEFKDRGSRFIAYAFPLEKPDTFRQNLIELKKEHHKAVHHCFAYRIGAEGQQYRAQDDGEPSGTAGLPILGQIDSRSLTNVAIIVVRYFGGTLLGKPGLINAYKSSSSLALDLAGRLKKEVTERYLLEFDYTVHNDVMQLLKQTSCRIISKDIQLFCRIEVDVPLSASLILLDKLKEWKSLDAIKLV